MNSQVIDNAAERRFELAIGNEVAIANYVIEDGHYVLVHTEVPSRLSGQGYGSALAQGTFEAIRRSGKRAIAKCSFMADYVARHPELADLVDP